jgi:hypothetical protein
LLTLLRICQSDNGKPVGEPVCREKALDFSGGQNGKSDSDCCPAGSDHNTIVNEPEMDRTADLGAVLGFVIGRIEEQAMRSGALSEAQRFLLNNLPHQSDTPEFTAGDPEFPLHFVPRDTTYERLCALAKAAHRSDVELNPGGQDWEFALNVSKLK